MSNPSSTPPLYGGAQADSPAPVAVRWTPGGQTALLKKTTYGMMGAAGVLLLGAGAGFFLISGKIQAAQAVAATKQGQVGSDSEIAKKFGDTLSAYKATQSQLKYLEKPGPASLYVPTLVPQVQKLAQSYGCTVKSLSPGAVMNANGSPTDSATTPAPSPAAGASTDASTAAAQPAYQTMILTMSLSGTYSQVMGFVYHLTRFPKMVTVKSLNLSPGTGGIGGPQTSAPSGPQQVSVDMTLMAYIFNPPADAPDTEEPSSTTDASAKLGSFSAAHSAEDDVMQTQVQQPVSAAMSVQQSSVERVQSAGLQAQPTPPTLPTNPALRK